MNITMKDTLRALRRPKKVTQEELANHLGITAQSVGKWERGEGFPDITLLPSIALYFGVTTDELLEIDKARIDERIKAIEDGVSNSGISAMYRKISDSVSQPIGNFRTIAA